MQEINNAMKSIIEKTDILLQGNILSRETLIKNFGKFLVSNALREKHNVGVIMHTGSVCFDVIAVAYAALFCILNNQSGSTEIIQTLEEGKLVLYGSKKKERYIFEGFVDGKELKLPSPNAKYMKLTQNGSSITYVAEKSWRLVEPYHGNSTRTDGRGIRKKTVIRDDFFTEVLGFSSKDIPAVIDTSCVIGMSREKADFLMKGISIGFDNKEIKLLDLVTASYFSEEDEYQYGGNTSKNEAVIKIAGKISVARSLLFNRRGNDHLGLIVLDREVIDRGVSELPELMNRKSLKMLYLCASIDPELATSLLNECDNAEIYACTKEYLVDIIDGMVAEENVYTEELTKQVYAIRNRKNLIESVSDAPIQKSEYKQIRKQLLVLKRSEYTSQNKDNFIIYAHSLLNFLITSPFTISEFERTKNDGLIDIDAPKQKLIRLEELILPFPSGLQETAKSIIDDLQKISEDLYEKNGKEKWIRQYLNTHPDEKIVIVVPKAYYIPIIQKFLVCSVKLKKTVTIVTMGRFDDRILYDTVIIVGDIEGKNFNAFRCNSAFLVVSLLYDSEIDKYRYKQKIAIDREQYIYRRSKHETIEEHNSVDNSITDEDQGTEEEIDNYISSLDSIFTIYNGSSQGSYSRHSVNAEVVSVAVFSDDTRAFFSKRYKGYVLDEETGYVKEKNAIELREGDSLIFTKNNNETKDIVDSILKQLVNEDKLPLVLSNAYLESKRWKIALSEYMNNNHLSERQVAAEMLEMGVSVQEATLLIWLDEDAHTVGPRKVDSIISIAEFVGDNELKKDADTIFQACKEVRSIRRRVLDQVGKAIIDRFTGHDIAVDSEFAVISESVENMAELKQIDRITLTNQLIPINLVNRALNL